MLFLAGKKEFNLSLRLRPDKENKTVTSYVRTNIIDNSSIEREHSHLTENTCVIPFMNHETFLGYPLADDYSENDPSETFYLGLTADEEMHIKLLLDALNPSEELGNNIAFISDLIITHQTSIENIILDPNDDLYEGGEVQYIHYFNNVYDLLLFECFELLRLKIGVGRCEYCGKYFLLPTKKSSKYCSRTCRRKADAERVQGDDIEGAARSAYKVKMQYLNRNREAPYVESAIRRWQYGIIDKQKALRDGKISFDDYIAYLEIPSKDLVGEEEKRQKSSNLPLKSGR